MTTFTTQTKADLDEQWVEDLLVTAFDAQYGGCWYWIRECRAERQISEVRILDVSKTWAAVEFDFTLAGTELGNGGSFARQGPARPLTCRVDKLALEYAWERVMNESLIRDDLAGQLIASMRSGDLDVDADVADCLVQIACFGEVVFA